jgi:hypothetical protein
VAREREEGWFLLEEEMEKVEVRVTGNNGKRQNP